jgi:hypothetical protein
MYHFTGVQGDKDRKGELFGMANLLKFVDGPFMNYGSGERKDRKRYGDLGIHSKDAVFNTVNDMAPEEIADVVGDEDAAVFADLSSRRVRHGEYLAVYEVKFSELIPLTLSWELQTSLRTILKLFLARKAKWR